jgi:cation diffusion facilitator family transporter
MVLDSTVLRAREGRRLVLVGVFLNIVLAVAKVTGGILGRSHALIADGIESSLDILSSTLMWGAMKYSERPPDEDHPYGHGKMESLAAFVGAGFLILAGLSLGIHSVREIVLLHSDSTEANLPAAFTLGILAATIVIKEGLFRWLRHRGEEIGSNAVQADAWHHRSDALTSLAAVVGITAALVGGPAWAQADDWAALFSCVLILFNGGKMLKNSIGDVLDQQASREIVESILATVREVPGVTSVEKCRVRKSGFSRFADLHVRVAGNRNVREGHEIAHNVKDRLMDAHFHLADVTVHIEPED